MKFTHLFTALVLGGAALAQVRCGPQIQYEEASGGGGTTTGGGTRSDGGTRTDGGTTEPRPGGGTHPW